MIILKEKKEILDFDVYRLGVKLSLIHLLKHYNIYFFFILYRVPTYLSIVIIHAKCVMLKEKPNNP